MSLGTEQPNSQLGDQMGKQRSMIVKASYVVGANPVISNLQSLISASAFDQFTADGLQLEEIEEMISVEILDAGLAVFSAAPSAALSANSIVVSATSTTGGNTILRISYLVK